MERRNGMKLDILKVPAQKLAGLARPLTSKLASSSPEILLVGGIAAVLGGTAMACATTWRKLPDRVNDKDERIAMCKPATREEKGRAYLEMAGKIALDYVPAALLTGGGILMIVGGHNQLRSRLGAMSAAYITLETAYSNYRARVIDDYGTDVDRKFRLGMYDEEVVTVKKGKNGKEKEKIEVIESVHPDGSEYSMYARYFDQFNSNMHVLNQEANFDFLRMTQNVANEKLQRRGYLFLNEVYEALGFEAVPEGQLVGWVKGMGDDYVDFGIFEARNADACNYIDYNGKETCFVLDFNVDGVMWDLI